jgi:ABC-type transporter Mla MlaB component
MRNVRPNGHKRGVNGESVRLAGTQGEANLEPTVLEVGRSGEWIPAEELMASAVKALRKGNNMVLDLNRIEHLDASALQILLALNREQKERGRLLDLTNASAHLRQWFDYSGSTDRFFKKRIPDE